MKIVRHQDPDGRRFAVALPDYEADSAAILGIRLGPPDLEGLGLPKDIEIRLNNQLYDRGLITAKDVKTRLPEVHAALMAALKVDAASVAGLYRSTNGAHNG